MEQETELSHNQEVIIRVESDIAEDIILELLSFIQRLGLGPKRRGLMRIEKVEKL